MRRPRTQVCSRCYLIYGLARQRSLSDAYQALPVKLSPHPRRKADDSEEAMEEDEEAKDSGVHLVSSTAWLDSAADKLSCHESCLVLRSNA